MRSRGGTYLIRHIDEGLSIICRELYDGFNLTTVGEDGSYQSKTFIRRKAGAGQPFPGGEVATCEHIVELMNRYPVE